MARTKEHDRVAIFKHIFENHTGHKGLMRISIEEAGKELDIPRRTIYKIFDEFLNKGWVRLMHSRYYFKDPESFRWTSEMIPWDKLVQEFWDCDDSRAREFLRFIQAHGWSPTYLGDDTPK